MAWSDTLKFPTLPPPKQICLSISLFSNLPLSSVCSFAHLNILFLLASLRYGFFFATLPRRPASRSRLFTVDIETGVLGVLFNEAASWVLVRCLFLKLDTLMYLSSCSVVHRDLPLLFLFWLEPVSLFCESSSTQRCTRSSVYWQFLAWNSLHFSEQE